MAIDKLSIQNEMAMLDRKDRKFYDSLSDDEKKKFSTFLMIRYGASVLGSPELQAYYLMSTNQKLNKNFFSINKSRHDKLLWLTATTISPGMGDQKHFWLSSPKKKESNSKVAKFFEAQNPSMKSEDIQLLASLNDLATVKKYAAEELGWTKEQIKSSLG